jgi:polyisoprenoid-binding protein YceI
MGYHYTTPLRAAVIPLIASLGGSPGTAQTPAHLLDFEIPPFHSRVEFSVPFMGLTSVKAAFEDFGGLLVYDPTDPRRSSVTFVIRTASLHSGNDTRDTHLRSDDFFDVERYPVIRFQSERLESREPGRYLASGTLSIHGVSRAVVLPVRIRHDLVSTNDGVDYLGFDATVRLNWRDFGIPGGNSNNPWFQPAKMLVSDSVDIALSIEATRRVPSRMHYPGLDSVLKVVRTAGTGELGRRYHALKAAFPDSVPRFAAPLADAGRALIERGSGKEGLAVLRLNLEAAPDDADALAALGHGFLILGDSASAGALYRRALRSDQFHATSLEMLRQLPYQR